MAKFRYQHIKSSVEGKAPTAEQIKTAEIGVNDFAGDEKLFIKNSESEVVDFPRGYSRAYIDEIERVAAESLNDLEERKLDASAYTPTDLSNYDTKGEVNAKIESATSGKVDTSAFSTYSAATKTVIDSKLDASAYTPTDLSNYYKKSETSGATEISTALGGKSDTRHTHAIGDITNLQTTLDSKANTATTLAGYSISDAYTKDETSGKTEISNALSTKVNSATYTGHTADTTIHFTTGAVQTQIDNSISGKVNTSDIISAITPSNSGSTVPIATKVVAENELIVSNALNDLDERKLDSSAYTPTDLSDYYKKSETSGATQISNALGAKVNTATFTEHTADTTIHHTSTSAVTSGSTDVITSGGVYAQLDGIKLKKITQSDYDQLQTKDPNTLYIITD